MTPHPQPHTHQLLASFTHVLVVLSPYLCFLLGRSPFDPPQLFLESKFHPSSLKPGTRHPRTPKTGQTTPASGFAAGRRREASTACRRPLPRVWQRRRSFNRAPPQPLFRVHGGCRRGLLPAPVLLQLDPRLILEDRDPMVDERPMKLLPPPSSFCRD